MRYKDFGLQARKAAAVIALFIVFVGLLFNRCSRSSNAGEKDAATLDSLSRNAPWFFTKVNVDLIAYAPDEYTLLVKAEADHGDRKVSHDTISFYVNDRKMEYSVGVGNYTVQTPAYHTSFDERSNLGETLKFTVKLKDSTHAIGYINIKPIMDFVANGALHKDLTTGKSKPFTIDWGGPLPDSVTVMQVKRIPNGNTESVEANLLNGQHWSAASSVIIDEKALNSGADSFEIAWWKESKGVNTHKKITCVINAIARVDQQVKVQ
jgi:hypothetical protein